MFSLLARLNLIRREHRPTATLFARFNARQACSVAAALILLSLGLPFGANAEESYTPAKNWVANLFTNEGYHEITARGTEMRMISAREFQVIDLSLTIYSGDAAEKLDTILLSPAATFLPAEKTAHGEKWVRFIGENIEASGTRWVYRHDAKKISLDGDVRVTFSAELKNLLQ